MIQKNTLSHHALNLESTHRLNTLPGFKEEIGMIEDAQIIGLEQGSSARGMLALKDRLTARTQSQGVTFLTSRPWQKNRSLHATPAVTPMHKPLQPTHLLCENLAYRLSSKSLTVGRGTEEEIDVRIQTEMSGINSKHFTIRKSGDDVILTPQGSGETFVDGARVSGTTAVQLGQIVRLGTPGVELHLIACVGDDETQKC
jgi:hypothetical protein